jgi:hypothetical protein
MTWVERKWKEDLIANGRTGSKAATRLMAGMGGKWTLARGVRGSRSRWTQERSSSAFFRIVASGECLTACS